MSSYCSITVSFCGLLFVSMSLCVCFCAYTYGCVCLYTNGRFHDRICTHVYLRVHVRVRVHAMFLLPFFVFLCPCGRACTCSCIFTFASAFSGDIQENDTYFRKSCNKAQSSVCFVTSCKQLLYWSPRCAVELITYYSKVVEEYQMKMCKFIPDMMQWGKGV